MRESGGGDPSNLIQIELAEGVPVRVMRNCVIFLAGGSGRRA